MGEKRVMRGVAIACAAAGVLLAGSVGHAERPERLVESKGTWRKGEMTVKLYRGVAVPDELLVTPTKGNCENALIVRLEWDQDENYVKVRVKGKNVLEPHPTVLRTEGVDFFTNQWWPEVKDVVNGRYQLWIIRPAEEIPYYYDPTTLEFIGGVHDFETPPEGAITLQIPGFNGVPTDFFQPDENGDVDFTHVFQYDKMVRGDLPDYAHIVATYNPHTLCTAHPFRYDQTSTRPYVSPTRPASEARPFSDFLRTGLILDTTIEPPEYFDFPPTSTNIATYSQATAIAGAVPRGWTVDLEAIFGNNAPPMVPWSEAGKCDPWFKPVRERDFNICVPSGEGE